MSLTMPEVPPEYPEPIVIDYEKSIYAPFEMSNSSNERVDINTGNLNLDFGLVQVPGINGNDVDLRIRYNSTDAGLYERSVGSGYQECYVVTYDLPAWHQSGGGWGVVAERYSRYGLTNWFSTIAAATNWILSNDGRIDYGPLPSNEWYTDTDYYDSIFASVSWINNVHEDGLTNPYTVVNHTESNPAPSSVYYDNGSYRGSLPRTGTNLVTDNGGMHYIESGERDQWYVDSTWEGIFSGSVYRYMTVTQYLYKYVITSGIIDYSYNYSYNTTQAATYTEKNNNLGAGWSWNLPSIEFSGGSKVLHLGGGNSYLVQDDLSLKNYTLQDMKLETDSAGYNNGQVSSAYVLKYKDGSKTYFASDGRVLCSMDRFGNTIRYQHTTISGHPVVNRITDTAGRDVTIAYNTTSTGREVVVTSPDGEQTKLLLEAVPGYSSDYVLKGIVTPNQAQTSFSYSYDTAGFDFLSKSPTAAGNVCANLTQVTYPTQAGSRYTYAKATDNLGEIGSYEVYKLSSRKDVEGTTEYDAKSYTYTYTGAAGGYPTHGNPQSLPDTFTYSVGVADAAGRSTTVTFNSKHLSVSEDVRDGSSPLYLKTQEYNTDKLPVRVAQRSYNGSGGYMESVLLYAYDSKGNVTDSWDEQALGDSADTEHKTVYTYDTTYSIPLTGTYKTDADTTILQQNTLTADGKSIQFAEVYENSVLKQKTEYLYDGFGNVTAERRYKDGFAEYIETTYSYADNVSGRTPALTGVYLTGKTVAGVLDDADAPVEGSPGSPDGTLTQGYTYDIMGRLTSATDAAGNTTAYQYDVMGRLLRITHPDASYIGYEYDYVSNWMIVTNELGGRTKYDYDGFGNEVAVIDLDANQTLRTTVYDSSFRVLRENNHNSSADSAETSYTYDKLNRVTLKQTRNKAGVLLAQESYAYDNAAESGQYAKVTKTVLGDASAPDMITVSYTDRSGRLIKQGRVQNGNECLDTFVYDYAGNKLQEKTAIAYAEYSSIPYTSKWEYDCAGRVREQYNALGDFASFTYDALGRLTSQTDYAGNAAAQPYSASFEYDVLGRKLRDVAPFEASGGTIHYSEASYVYDQNGNVISERHSTGLPGGTAQVRTTDYAYDARNRLTGVTLYPESGVPESTGYTYDAMGNKLTMTVGTAVTEYEYDTHGRLLSLTDPLGQTESYAYDANGNLTSKTDRSGAVTAYVYDGLSRKLSETVTLDGQVTAQTLITYTLTGQVKTEQNANTTLTRTYDTLGRMVNESETGGIDKSYAYNLADLRTSYTLTRSGTAVMSTTYTYDHLNRLSTVSENGTQVAAYTYDVNGNRATLTNGNGTSVTYAYNLANLVTSLTNKKGTETLSAYAYTYYLDGNQATKADHTGRTTGYTYDGAGRLTREAESGAADAVTKAYTFDARGNRVTMTVSGAESYTTSYAYDLNNRLLTETKDDGTAQSVTEYFYDPNGNQIAKTVSTLTDDGGTEGLELTLGASGAELFAYDGFNRLVSVENNAGVRTYAYRPDGLRMSKTTGGVTITHIWDGQDITAELDGSGAVIDRYIRGVGLIASDNHGYYLYNAHGDVVQLTNDTGAVTKEYHYDAFGNEKSPNPADANPFRYCGEYFDKETGTIYLRARYYDPTIGRFLSEDTIRGKKIDIFNSHQNDRETYNESLYSNSNKQQYVIDDPLSLNLYTYCQNNPVLCFLRGEKKSW